MSTSQYLVSRVSRQPISQDMAFVLPALLVFAALVAVHVFNLDILLSDYIYRLEGGEWTLRYTWWTSEVLHKGSQRLSIFVGVITLSVIICSCFVTSLRPYRRGLIAAFVAAITSLLLVSLFKHQLPIACPYDMQRYGGELAGHAIFNLYWHQDVGGCFPAGHAAGGYCFLVWFFFARHYRLKHYQLVLLPGVILGLINGIDQQLRGAHFLSHDLSSILLCWIMGYLLFRLIAGPAPARI